MIEFVILSLLTSLQFFFVVPLVIGHVFRIQGYKVTDQTECNTLIRKLKIKHSSLVQNEKPFGFFYGKWFVGYMCSHETQNNHSQIMYLITLKDNIMQPNSYTKKLDIIKRMLSMIF